MKFIHAADLHLDSPMRGLEQYEGAPALQLRGSTRQALQNLVRLAVDEQVDFVVVAGDVYDGDWTDYSTGLFFARQMTVLREAGIKTFLVRGNHDATSQITRQLTLPDNVHEFSTRRPETVVLDDLGVAIHGQSFSTRAVTQDLSAAYPLANKQLFNIGVLHTSADGREGHENYAPCTIAGLLSRGYDYWALGHVHDREELSKDPWIVFSGNIQGRHMREQGKKGCSLVTVVDGRISSVVHHSLDVARWCECIVSADGAADIEELLDRSRSVISATFEDAEERLLAVRLVLRGACSAHRHVVAQHDQFTSECQALANDIGNGRIWIERMIFQTRMEFDLEEIAKRQGALGDLLRFVRGLPSEEATLRELLIPFKSLQQKIPLDLRQGDDAIALDDPRWLARLLPDVEQILMPRLIESEVPQ